MDKLTDLLASIPAVDSALDTTHRGTTNDRNSSDVPPTPAVQNKRRRECPICYERLYDPLGYPEAISISVETICGHTFYWDCQYTWEATSDTCAMCRAPLQPEVKPTTRMPPYESPIDERYPQHFDDSAEITEGYSFDDEEIYRLQDTLRRAAYSRLYIYVDMVTCRSHSEVDAPPIFAVNIPGNDSLCDKYDPPCETARGRDDHWTHRSSYRDDQEILRPLGPLQASNHKIFLCLGVPL